MVQESQILMVLKNHADAFAWDYVDMKGIDPKIFQHHIYIDDTKPIQQLPRKVNPTLNEVVRIGIEKLVEVEFIYLIFDSR